MVAGGALAGKQVLVIIMMTMVTMVMTMVTMVVTMVKMTMVMIMIMTVVVGGQAGFYDYGPDLSFRWNSLTSPHQSGGSFLH